MSSGSLSQAKTLGGVGSILVLLSAVPTVGWVLGIIGFVMTLIAVKNISDTLQDRPIFSNFLIAVILGIVGLAIGGIIVAGTIFRFIGLGAITTGTVPSTLPSNIVGLVAGLIVGLAVVWIVLIVSSYFMRKSYNEIGSRLNVGMFKTAALLYFIGAILVIVVIGFLLILVAQILFIVAFFSIPESPAVTVGSGGNPPPPPPGAPGMMSGPPGRTSGTKFCVKCGASLARDASYCPACGASQPTTNM